MTKARLQKIMNNKNKGQTRKCCTHNREKCLTNTKRNRKHMNLIKGLINSLKTNLSKNRLKRLIRKSKEDVKYAVTPVNSDTATI